MTTSGTAYSDVVQIVSGFVPADEIKKLVSTAITANTYTGTALNGTHANVLFKTAGIMAAKRRLIVTTSAQPGAYNITDPIVFFGLRDGTEHGAPVWLTAVNGNETVQTAEWLESVTSLYVPAQTLATGQFAFSVGDVVFDPAAERIRAGAAGTFKVYVENGARDLVMASGEELDLAITGVQRSNTTYPLTVLLT